MTKEIRVGVIGAGRIGKLHIENLARNIPGVKLIGIAVLHVTSELLTWAKSLGINHVYSDAYELINQPDIDAIVISSSTNTHVDFMIACAKAGKHIFIEKPIDVDINKAKIGIEAVESSGVIAQLGFVRRFDSVYKAVFDDIVSNKFGKPKTIKIISKDPYPPSLEYTKVCGGMFMDMSIHDFDMARFLSSSEVKSVNASGSAIINPSLKELGDIDTARTILTMENGIICTIENCRRSDNGYDLRVEVECENGTIFSKEVDQNLSNDEPFFVNRFKKAFLDEMISFVECVKNNKKPQICLVDGLKAMIIAGAAKKSLTNGYETLMN